ncbi:MAG: hypothetical protein JKY42_07260, partial [Flavobacteriales bacterium]|nr:hypothetical protein [Flavobacteriales bacterium]
LEHPELIKIQQYGKLEGFTGIECNQNAICKDHWGDIWFGTANYVSRYNSWADDFNTVEPETHITGLKLFFEEEDWSKYAEKVNTWDHLPSNLNLTYEKNHLTFDFVGISLKIPEKVRYQYMLEGLDDNWSPPSTQTFATYPQLPPGKYTFTVKACNNDGIWNKEPAVFQFVITPPFWKTIWFYTLCIGIIVSSIYITVRLRIRNLERAKKLLEQQVKLRTNQLRKEKVLVERQKGELELAYNKLKDLENFKQSLMGMIVHDLKNPLNSILAFSNYEPAKDVLRNIGQAGKQMLNLVLNILDVQKFEDTTIKLNVETQQIYRLAKEAINQTTHLAEQKEITLTIEIDQNITVKAEEEIIIRVLVNLLTNAIKYTPTRGKVIISNNIQKGDETIISVQDSGIGIPSDKLGSIFDRFAQVESKDSGQVTSTGLGLTFCKMAIEAHEGVINVESEVGKGTTFSFSLPLGEEIEIEIIDENQKEPKEKNNIKLGKKEKEIIAFFITDFSLISVYHTSENISILSQIQADDNAIISRWKKEVELAVYNCNEEKYIELLKLLE